DAIGAPAQKISTEDIIPNRLQPRKFFDEASLLDLAESIKKHGLAQPIVVAHIPDEGRYELIAGERRFRACKLAGISKIDAVIRPKPSAENMLALSLVENIQREDLNPIETASAFKELTDKFNIAQKELARYCGKSKAFISNTLRLLELAPEIQKAVQNRILSEGHARILLSIPDKGERTRFFHEAVTKKLSVRQLEDIAKSCQGKIIRPRKKLLAKRPHEIVQLEGELQKSLGTKVEIRPGAKTQNGVVAIHYYSYNELGKLCSKLKAK
ncbi:MAG: ParB/RepB/Spo0J family partition protein, partial [Elusimicrobia bacterium]|nr:ParB/RepB/Spo0J family partition protein [Elusimicrobiota bacterium]